MKDIQINAGPPEPSLEIRPAPRQCIARWMARSEDETSHGNLGIFVTQAAYRAIRQHAARTLEFEVGGMLVGHAFVSPAGKPYIVVEGSLEAKYVNHSRVHLTFTSDALADMLNRLEESYPGKQIVGWYHTHPGLSIFLSGLDTWLHTNFFPQPWHVALVVDPQAEHGGFFYYANGNQADLNPHAYIGFYELGAPGASSVVAWRNLIPAKVEYMGMLWQAVETIKD